MDLRNVEVVEVSTEGTDREQQEEEEEQCNRTGARRAWESRGRAEDFPQ